MNKANNYVKQNGASKSPNYSAKAESSVLDAVERQLVSDYIAGKLQVGSDLETRAIEILDDLKILRKQHMSQNSTSNNVEESKSQSGVLRFCTNICKIFNINRPEVFCLIFGGALVCGFYYVF